MSNVQPDSMTRPRQVVRAAALLALIVAGALGAGNGLGADQQTAAPNPIQQENALEGATDWQLTRTRVDRPDGCRCLAIEGYCSRQSVAAGEKLQIMVSTQPASEFQIEIFRTGYYGGRGASLVQKIGPLAGKPQPTPQPNERTMHECRWERSAEFAIPADWISGVYLGRLTTLPETDDRPYWQSYVVFIVRDDRPAAILFQCSDNTWQAYNASGRGVPLGSGVGNLPKMLETLAKVKQGPVLLSIECHSDPDDPCDGVKKSLEFLDTQAMRLAKRAL